jgi:hypothetical protein
VPKRFARQGHYQHVTSGDTASTAQAGKVPFAGPQFTPRPARHCGLRVSGGTAGIPHK